MEQSQYQMELLCHANYLLKQETNIFFAFAK